MSYHSSRGSRAAFHNAVGEQVSSTRIAPYSMKDSCIGPVIGIVAAMAIALPVFGAQEDLLEMYGSREMISLATGYRKPIFEAPANATVVTSEDIRKMGATTLDEVLATIPGFHVSSDGKSTLLTVRGITSRVLILVDNIPVAQGLTNPFGAEDNILLYNIERVEVVRGPGSAIYGADAFAGVVNLVTKSAGDIGGTEIGGLAGSFDTYDAHLLHGGKLGDVDVAFSLMARTTDGHDETIEADAQTVFDTAFRTDVSFAPGPIQRNRDIIDTRLDLSKGPWAFHVRYFNQDNFKNGGGIAQALDPAGTVDFEFISSGLTYRTRYSDSLELMGNFTYVSVDTIAKNLLLFPPGAFGGAFPDGVRQNLVSEEDRFRAELTGEYSGIPKHTLRLGTGWFYNDYDNTEDRRNYTVRNGVVLPTGTFAELGGVGDSPIFPDTDREVFFAYGQDEWALAPDWALTAGLRWDHYSDFGDTVNPRAGLVWNTRHDISTKLLYGRAFRPPSVTELESNGLLIALGNDDLDPVTIDTLELAVNYRSSHVRGEASAFWYDIDDLVQQVENDASPNGLAFVNLGGQEGAGVEFSLEWDVAKSFHLKGNYAFQERLDDESDDNANVRFAPKHKAYLEGNWAFAPDWNLNANVIGVFGRERRASDPRSDIDDYTLFNLTLERLNIARSVDASLSIRNVFDEDERDPSQSATTIPFDIPLAGRNVYGQIRARF